MLASMKVLQLSTARRAAYEQRIWNDALQAAALALACGAPGPMRSGALIDPEACVDCEHKECARQVMIRQILALKYCRKNTYR